MGMGTLRLAAKDRVLGRLADNSGQTAPGYNFLLKIYSAAGALPPARRPARVAACPELSASRGEPTFLAVYVRLGSAEGSRFARSIAGLTAGGVRCIVKGNEFAQRSTQNLASHVPALHAEGL